MSSNRFKDLFKKILDKRKDFVQYWNKSPSTKIIILNVGVYVHNHQFSVFGNLSLFLKSSQSNTSQQKNIMSQKVDYILSLLIPFPTQESSVYVNKNKFSLRCAHAWTHGKSDSDKLWTQIYPLALRLRSSFRRHYFNSFSAPISLHSA